MASQEPSFQSLDTFGEGLQHEKVSTLEHWCLWILELKQMFNQICFQHFYWEFNEHEDIISKKTLTGIDGLLHVEEHQDGNTLPIKNYQFY